MVGVRSKADRGDKMTKIYCNNLGCKYLDDKNNRCTENKIKLTFANVRVAGIFGFQDVAKCWNYEKQYSIETVEREEREGWVKEGDN